MRFSSIYGIIVVVYLGGITLEIKKLFAIIKEIYKRIKKNEVTSAGAELTYYLILSFFPFLIFLITLASYSPVAENEVLMNLSRFLPYDTYQMVIGIINQILRDRSTSLLSIGMIATLWTASHGLKAIIRGTNKAYNERETRPYWKIKSMAILFTVALAIAIVFTFIAIVIGNFIATNLFGFLKISNIFLLLWSILRYVIPLASLFIIFAFIYKYAPNFDLSFKSVYPGALFSTFGWILISVMFSYYVDNFSGYSKTYGSIAGIFVLLIWLYLSSIIFLIGGEINATLYFSHNNSVHKYKKKKGTSL